MKIVLAPFLFIDFGFQKALGSQASPCSQIPKISTFFILKLNDIFFNKEVRLLFIRNIQKRNVGYWSVPRLMNEGFSRGGFGKYKEILLTFLRNLRTCQVLMLVWGLLNVKSERIWNALRWQCVLFLNLCWSICTYNFDLFQTGDVFMSSTCTECIFSMACRVHIFYTSVIKFRGPRCQCTQSNPI